MDSFLSTTLASAALQAESILGETVTLAGTDYTGVVEEMENLLPPGAAGYESQRVLLIALTAAQFTTAPTAATRPKLTARGATWTLTAVKPGPLHYHLTCVPGT